MSLIDRINRAVADRVRPPAPTVQATADALLVGEGAGARRLPFATLRRATLLHRDAFVGDDIVLQLGFDGGTVELSMGDDGWAAVVAALDETALLGAPAARWQAEAIADGAGAPPRVLLAR